jgi:aspartyl-tRNA(Asn)/glutamyl-tRNA(Gln) amidotransferase subunit A
MFNFTNIADYIKSLHNSGHSCKEAVEHFLAEIERNTHLNAFVQVYNDEALQRAEALDDKRKSGAQVGKLHGVVIAIKDVICYKDHEVTAASNMLKHFTSIYNATAVQKMLDEDAIIIGSCNCDEFAMGSTNENSVYGPTLNALDNTKVAGGSSGGSAVAVQAGMCMLSLGSDTGGSVRQPADFCGIVGLKPTYGRISRYGLIAYASSFDQVGIFGKNVQDVQLLLEVISGPDQFDSTAIQQSFHHVDQPSQEKYRIAYFPEAIDHPALDDEIRTSISDLLKDLKEDHEVEPVSFTLLDHIVPTYYVLTTAEATSNLSRYDGVRFGHRTAAKTQDLTEFYKKNRSEGFGMEVKRRIMLGNYVLSEGYFDAYFTKAQQVRRKIIDQVSDIFQKNDVVFIPTSPTTAFSLGQLKQDPVSMYLADIYTVFANLAGIPAISIPLWRHSNGMPYGLQIMSNKIDEVTLLRISGFLMQQYKRSPDLINT